MMIKTPRPPELLPMDQMEPRRLYRIRCRNFRDGSAGHGAIPHALTNRALLDWLEAQEKRQPAVRWSRVPR